MKRFFQPQRKPAAGAGPVGTSCSSAASNAINTSSSTPSQSSLPVANDDDGTKKSRVEINVDALDLEYDPGKRPPIESYEPNIRDEVRMIYLERGPCQPHVHSFPKKFMGKERWCFRKKWFAEFHWLEYSIEKDFAFCLYCYLFKPDRGGQGGGGTFMKTGFRDWKDKQVLKDHVGLVTSAHHHAFTMCTNLLNQRRSISFALSNQKTEQQNRYATRLTTVLAVTRFLLMQGLAFRGHDESEKSLNRGNFLELLIWYAYRCEKVNEVVLGNAPRNDQMTAPSIQKDLVNCCAVETTRAIMKELGDSVFSILVDEARDNSVKEQMAVVLRYVDKSGSVKERFLAISHIIDTSAQSPKDGIDEIFSKHGLSISKHRGQGYDVASNMSGEFNGLKTLILRENPCAQYVHCFAHQLQLCLVSVARRTEVLANLFNILSIIVNLVGASCKHVDALRASYHAEILAKLNTEELCSGSGKFQDMSLARPGDTRWSLHLLTITRFIGMFNNIIDVLENIVDDGISLGLKGMAGRQLDIMQDFEFVFFLHFMFDILAVTDDLSQALQKKDQDIENAMRLLSLCRTSLQCMRDDSWDNLSSKVIVFCVDREVVVPNLEDIVVRKGRPRRGTHQVTYHHHFFVELYCHVIDSILQELNDHFSETSTELLTCISCLNPNDSFACFDTTKLVRLAQLYPMDFTTEDIMLLRPQLDKFLMLVRSDATFANLLSISCITERLVQTGCQCYFPLVYRLITLVLTLPVATVSVERAFSAMNLIKNDLSNKMSDVWLNDNLVVYTERGIFKEIEDEAILKRFQTMRPRRMQLSSLTNEN